jgi:hypothetical protein
MVTEEAIMEFWEENRVTGVEKTGSGIAVPMGCVMDDDCMKQYKIVAEENWFCNNTL